MIGRYLGCLCVFIAGCADADQRANDRVSITAQALSLDEIGGASYGIAVKNAEPTNNLVWSRQGITAAQFGDGQGAIAYVGPCDASSNPNTVELVLENLYGTDGAPIAPDTWVNPAPPGAPVVISMTCEPDTDVAVDFNLTVMRSAVQGFFDIAVNFEDIFCSAKVDCQSELLHDGDERAPTVVMGFACTAGSRGGSAQPTWLHMSDIVLECAGQPPLYFDPTGPLGNNGPLGTAPSFFQTGIYRGQETLPEVDKCYWNSAFGVRIGDAARDCRLRAQATASHASFGPNGMSPANTTYPYVAFDVVLTNSAGALICDNNGLDAADSDVRTHYTPPNGGAFTHEWECNTGVDPIDTRLLCEGAFAGDTNAAVLPTPEGLSVAIGGVRSPSYELPAGVFVDGNTSCCANPCCDATATP